MQSRLITEVAFSLLGGAHGMHAPACIAGASNPLHVVANERLPGLQWAIPPRHHVDRNRGLRDLDAQLEQFAMDLGWSFRKGQLAARQLASLFCMGQAWKIATVANLTHRRKIASSAQNTGADCLVSGAMYMPVKWIRQDEGVSCCI